MKETVDLRRTGAAAAALQVLLSDRGEQLMGQIRDAIAAMRAAEASLLEEEEPACRRRGQRHGLRYGFRSGPAFDRAAGRLAGYRPQPNPAAAGPEALRESEAQFRTLANAIPQLCWMANADGWIFWYNERWYEYTGATPEQMGDGAGSRCTIPESLPEVLD